MTVRELIEALSKEDPDARCVVSGYEDGVTDVVGVEQKEVVLDCNGPRYYGEHDDHPDATGQRTGVVKVKGRRH